MSVCLSVAVCARVYLCVCVCVWLEICIRNEGTKPDRAPCIATRQYAHIAQCNHIFQVFRTLKRDTLSVRN